MTAAQRGNSAADRVRRVMAEDRRDAYPYVTGVAQAVVAHAVSQLDHGDVAGARAELAGLLDAIAVLSEPADEARRKLAGAEPPAAGR